MTFNVSTKDMQNNESPQAVRLIGIRDGLLLSLKPETPIETLKQEIEKVFQQAAHLTRNAKIVLDWGNDLEYPELEQTLAQYLIERFQVGMVLRQEEAPKEPPGKDKEPRRYDINRSWQRSDALILAGRIRSGQNIEGRHHVVILGDVNPGAEIRAGGDIIVVGTLGGVALAGQPDNEAAIVFAMEFKPLQVQIGRIIAIGTGPSHNKTPEIAAVQNGLIVVASYANENPFAKYPYPMIR